VLRAAAAARAVLVNQFLVRELSLRVLVEELHVGVGRSGVQVEVVLLHVLAVVRLGADAAEHTLLQDGVATVPDGEREAEDLITVAEARDAVLAPAVRARA